VERRLAEHNSGAYGGYTSKRLPSVLRWSEHFLDITAAIAVSKGRSRVVAHKEEALIRWRVELIGFWRSEVGT